MSITDWSDTGNSVALVAALTLTDINRSLYRLDLSQAGAKLQRVSQPGVTAEVVAAGNSLRILAFKQDEPDGTAVKICRTDAEACTSVLKINPQLAEIAAGQKRIIEYQSTDGKKLNAVVLLPPDYHPGQAYPTIVSVYGGRVYRTMNSAGLTVADNGFDNPQVLAAHGYVVLFPSIPMSPYGRGSDPLKEMARSVMPAVDQIIAAGIADENRLGLIGHSYGAIRRCPC